MAPLYHADSWHCLLTRSYFCQPCQVPVQIQLWVPGPGPSLAVVTSVLGLPSFFLARQCQLCWVWHWKWLARGFAMHGWVVQADPHISLNTRLLQFITPQQVVPGYKSWQDMQQTTFCCIPQCQFIASRTPDSTKSSEKNPPAGSCNEAMPLWQNPRWTIQNFTSIWPDFLLWSWSNFS